jgi:PAS domain S-box-containing protein
MNPKKILIVEDDNLIAESLESGLNGLGYDVVGISSTGTNAIEKAGLLKPDLILMDIILQDQVSGIEAAEVIRIKYGIPVVFLTASTDPSTVSDVGLTSPFGFVGKPFNETELHASVEIALQKSSFEKRIENFNKILKAIRTVNRQISQENDLSRLLKKICQSLTETNVFNFSWILILDDKKNVVNYVSSSVNEQSGKISNLSIMEKLPACAEEIFDKKETLVIRELEKACKECGLHIYCEGNFEILVPLLFKESFYGLLAVITNSSHEPTEEEISLIEEVGLDIAFAIQQFELELAKEEFADALMRSEQRFRNLIEISNDAIYLLLDGKFEIINDRFTKLFGYTIDEIKSQNIDFKDLVASKSRDLIEERERKLKEGRQLDSLFEFTALTKHGFEIDCEVSVSYLQYERKTATHGIIRDISNRKQMERALIEAKENAEKSDKLKSEFLAQISHEIRTPINSILNFSDLIKENINAELDKDVRTGFEIIRRSGNRIARTIDLIINMAELQVGTYNFTPREIKLYDEILVNLFNEFNTLAEEKGLSLKILNYTDDTTVLVDKYAVNQIFTNLIDNAIKYTFEGEIKIIISKDESGSVVGEVTDTGIGIIPDYLPNLFNPFTQEEQGYTRKFEGNGLGLALVKKYCDMNKAQITVKSEKGSGSSFRVTFPIYHKNKVLAE